MQGRDRVQKFKAIFFLLFLIFVTRAGTLLQKGDNMVKTEKRYSNFAKDFFLFVFCFLFFV